MIRNKERIEIHLLFSSVMLISNFHFELKYIDIMLGVAETLAVRVKVEAYVHILGTPP